VVGENWVELRVEVPGRYNARYEYDHRTGDLRLGEVLYPAEWYPADLCSVTDSFDGPASPLGALLLGNVSLPAGCLAWGRLLGLLEIQDGGQVRRYILAVAAMHSTLRRGLLSHRKLEEGVLVVSDQQITSVVELLPPDRAGIRYGFVARAGVPERLEDVRLRPLRRNGFGLELTWRAAGGSER